MSEITATVVDGVNAFIQNMVYATRYTIIILDNHLNGMADRADLTRSLTVRMKRSILGTCSFLDTQLRFIPRSVTYVRSGYNSLSECMWLILKSRCRYNLCTSVIPSIMFLIFQFFTIIPVVNMMCHDMVLRKPIPVKCMSSYQMVIFFYLSRMVLGILGILTGSTCWILHRIVLPFWCGMMGP